MNLDLDKHDRRITDPGPQAEARRLSIEERLLIVENRADRIPTIEAKLDANTVLTRDIVDMFRTMSAGVQVLGAIGRLAKWAAPIAALAASIWAIMSSRGPGN